MKWHIHVSLTALIASALGFIALSQPAAPQEEQLGIAPNGVNALEFISKIDQVSSTATSYGYLTHIFDVPDDALFANPTNPTEATARFTFSATQTLDTPRLVANLIVHSATGTVTFYFNQNPTGNFLNPSSFSSGQVIATYSTRSHDVLNVQAPNQGITTTVSNLEQLTANRFTLLGKQHQLGRKGLLLRAEATGEATRTQVTPLVSVTFSAGNVVITGQR